MDWENGKKVLGTGKCLVRYSKWFLWLIPAAVGLIVLCVVGLLAFGSGNIVAYLKLSGTIGMVNFLLAGSYLVLVLGVCDWILYFVGIHFIGLGQLVINTCPPIAAEPEEEVSFEEEEKQEPEAEEAPEEAPEAEEIPEEEEEPDWHALLEQDDAVVPELKTPEQMVEELPPPGKSGRLVSPALMNILRYSLGLEEDEQMKAGLKNGMTRLTKPHERGLLGSVLHIPDGDVRSAADRLYKILSQKK